jgi:hypothetical protein
MRPIVTVAVALLLSAGAQASEVYKTTDAQGRPVYTDKPPSLPAKRLNVQSATTDTVEVQRRYDAELKRYDEEAKAGEQAAAKAAEESKARELTAEDRARRCIEARQHYEKVMTARRLYSPGASEGERSYLSDAEIDAARANAKQAMDELCRDQ